ncbi:pseudouridine synthase [Undibacterium sp. SXout7W]|uniref:pseudouridine synthase n=1 Tax=Undibacterium sp. SXout7W TaxID=3413049 RepID=UPI003BF081FB
MSSPLPVRDGIAPSYCWLPEGRWNNLLSFLLLQFPDVAESVWRSRLARNEVVDAHGIALSAHSEVRRGMCIYYYRELEHETVIPFEEIILFQDEHLLVVDKPHFLPVTPGGRFLQETLLVRLRKKTGLQHLVPIHRLDRETAGVMLFSHNPTSRGLYQAMFQRHAMRKIYHAIAPALTHLDFPFYYRSRMVDGDRFFVMQEAPGEVNSETLIDIYEKRGRYNVYQLSPRTGKKHQLRLHLASLGAPIVNDSFYPDALPCKGDDFSAPLQLLAKSISFTDPLTQQARFFESLKTL